MKKLLVYSLGTIVVLGLIAYVTLQFFLGSIVKAGVNKFGPGITQTKVELQHASLSPLSGSGSMTGLTVGNPAGWNSPNAFHLGRIHIDMEPFSVFGDHVVINELIIDQPEFTYETKLVSSNITDILKNIEKSLGTEKAGNQPKAQSGKPIKIEVKRLVLRNGRVTLGLGTEAITLALPPVELTNIGTEEGGVTPAGLAFAIMRSVTPTIIAASTDALGKLGGTSGAAAAEAAKQAGEAIKNWFGGKKQ